MDKLGRNYILTVQLQNGETLIIKPPFTIEFDITRNTLASSNVGSIRIYNLSANHRSQIRFNKIDSQTYRSVKLQAGYGNNLPIVFSGNITQAWSVREGNNFITAIECFDAGFAFVNGLTNTNFPKNTEFSTMLKTLAGTLPEVTVGAIGQYLGSITRGNSLKGSTTDLLTELTGGGFFIDNGIAHCLGDSECLQGEMLLINAKSGLLGTPVREVSLLSFDMIFEPRLIVCQIIELQSATAQNFNGFYKITSLKHRGTISESVCGDAITTLGMFYGDKALKVVSLE